MEARVSEQPALDERRLVRRVVVQHQVHLEVRWYFCVNAIQKLAELSRTVSAMQFADDFATGDIQGREQRGGAVALVIIGAPLDLARPHGQNRLCPIEGLDLTLLVG